MRGLLLLTRFKPAVVGGKVYKFFWIVTLPCRDQRRDGIVSVLSWRSRVFSPAEISCIYCFRKISCLSHVRSIRIPRCLELTCFLLFSFSNRPVASTDCDLAHPAFVSGCISVPIDKTVRGPTHPRLAGTALAFLLPSDRKKGLVNHAIHNLDPPVMNRGPCLACSRSIVSFHSQPHHGRACEQSTN